jgi:pyridoxamine 5'-phosphate oxidase
MNDVNDEPFPLFASWYEEAAIESVPHRDIIALATATRDGRPSVRMVYYRGLREGGFSFFTNYDSRKGRELRENPFAAIVFYWAHLGKQVRIEGEVARLSPAESDLYFRGRPFQSQITATLSRQSQPIPDDAAFLSELRQAEQALREQTVARPETWGGFKLTPSLFEFWTHGEHRRHQRIVYEKKAGWQKTRLYP